MKVSIQRNDEYALAFLEARVVRNNAFAFKIRIFNTKENDRSQNDHTTEHHCYEMTKASAMCKQYVLQVLFN